MEALFGKDNLEHLRAVLNASQANREGGLNPFEIVSRIGARQ
jgi:hypothetical protein